MVIRGNILQKLILILCKDKESLRQYKEQIVRDLLDSGFDFIKNRENYIQLKAGTRIDFAYPQETFIGQRYDEFCIEEGVDKRMYEVLSPMLIRYGNMCIFNDINSLYLRTNQNIKEYFKEN